MTSERVNRGVSRVLAKLDQSVEAEDYYEAHQMYRTLYFRYIGQRKYDECLDLLYRGSLTLLNKEQVTSGADLTLLIIDTLEKKGSFDDYAQWIQRLGVLIKKISPSNIERETIIARSIKWSGGITKSNLGNPEMHKVIAQILWAEGNSCQARHHYLLSRDGIGCGQMLVQISQKRGYANETDLFIVQVVLQQLCLKERQTALKTFETYAKYHPKIATEKPPFILPLLNFIFFLFKTIETGQIATFKSLCDLYKPSLSRDPSYDKYLQKIGVIFFGAEPIQQSPGVIGGLIGDLLNRLMHGFDDDEEDEQSQEHQQDSSRQIRLNNTNSAAELD